MMKPNDQRNFVHKRIIGAVGGFLTGGVTGAIGGAITGGRSRSGGQPVFQIPGGGSQVRGRNIAAISQNRPCGNPANDRGPDGVCRKRVRGVTGFLQRGIPGGATGFEGAGGAAVMGQYGAALAPFEEARVVRSCLPGMVLGNDGLCYNRRDISNKEREYPKGTRPLGTPGEMAALRKAASFGRRMETTVKRMQKIGVLKKPTKARRNLIHTTAAQHHAGG